MNPQTVIELAQSENRGRLPRGAPTPTMRTRSATVRRTIGVAMVRCGQLLASGRTGDAAAPRGVPPTSPCTQADRRNPIASPHRSP